MTSPHDPQSAPAGPLDEVADASFVAAHDRRRFMKRAAVAGAAAWAAPTIISSPAMAQGSGCVALPVTGSWSSIAAGQPGAGFAFYPWNVPPAPNNGTTMTIVWIVQSLWTQFGGAGTNRTCVQQGPTGGLASGVGYWRSDKDRAANANIEIPNGAAGAAVFELQFSQAVCDLTFTILDCDQNLSATGATEWTDQVLIEPFNVVTPMSGTYTPQANSTFITPNTPQVGTSATFTGAGGTNCADSSAAANIAVAVPGPVTRVRIAHNMQMPPPRVGGDRQHIGIAAVSWG